MSFDFAGIITPSFILVALACGVIAAVFKGVPKLPGWLIPIVNLVVGAVAMCILAGVSGESAIYGIIAASAECFIYEAFTSTFNGIKKVTAEVEAGKAELKAGGTDD
jgi:hypothetical protein